MTVRLRLTVVYGLLFLVSGAGLLAITYLLVGRATGSGLFYQGPNGETFFTFSGSGGAAARGIAGPGSPGIFPSPQDIQALASQQHAAEMNQLLVQSGVALAIMAVVSIGIGWLVAGRVLRPVRTMTAAAREISAASFHQRLVLDGPDDELKELGNTFNDLLARLERSFDAQRQFVANASHELRTPLARQKTLLQVALSDPEVSLDSLRATCERVLVAGEQQEGLIEALFTLARGERGLERREAIDLATLAGDVLRTRRADAEAAGVELDAHLDPAPTQGDPRLLERLIANLVDNAIRYNAAHGQVTVITESRGPRAVLRLSNDGPVVPSAEVVRLFQPFQRLAADRTAHGDGWGLGLSIVRAIATSHGAAVTAQARSKGGLAIEVSFAAGMSASATPPGEQSSLATRPRG